MRSKRARHLTRGEKIALTGNQAAQVSILLRGERGNESLPVAFRSFCRGGAQEHRIPRPNPSWLSLLKDRQFSVEVARVLRKMKPTRQVKRIELMFSANSLPMNYAEALLPATPVEMLVDGTKPATMKGVTPERMARMERESS
ncbi:plasmid partitioning protein RepB C-terminal domain-containing protein [Thiobacillus sedimenti]|uniref:Plasmid partitioning protein RepB C-terminal domain-containing protein n=1 Tax=Thiobacillus sedimenti TaxID=3110231 RepID=A0ABZ1CIK9_9PROT|nr:plasmid partitioning protein RepB C-terminal domain-containing protein [Thiobacillus sp. SCUT-2]WRS39242.1 plasmid partitioning protein RepB C-terminal domain-containing protein [Thiobacillus sp. SCUT-2]